MEMINIFNPSEEKLEKSLDSLLDKMYRKEIKKVELIKSKGKDIMRRIYEILEKDGYLDDENLLYFPEKYSVTGEEYHALFESMTNYAEEDHFYCDEENPFSNESVYYDYNGDVIELFTMSGQGTITSFSKMGKDDIKETGIDKIVVFDDFINSVN